MYNVHLDVDRIFWSSENMLKDVIFVHIKLICYETT